DDSAANSTSLSITIAVTPAGTRATPYCSAKLPASSASASAIVPRIHVDRGGGGQSIVPPADIAQAIPQATAKPPTNIVSARTSSGASRLRRTSTLTKAKQTPPATPSQSASDDGNGRPVPGRHRTIAAPASASDIRASAA